MSEPGLDTTSDARSSTSAAPLLEIEDLHVRFQLREGDVKAVNGVSLSIPAKGTIGLVGESGCGKSVTALSIMRLVPSPPGNIVNGKVIFDGQDLLNMTEEEMQAVRGRNIGMIFQEPMTSLNPVLTIGSQLEEPLNRQSTLSRFTDQSF